MDVSGQLPVYVMLAGFAMFPIALAWLFPLNPRKPRWIRVLGLLPTIGAALGWLGFLCFTFPVFSGGKTIKGDEWLPPHTVYVKGYTRETTPGLWRFQRWSDKHIPRVMVVAAAVSVLGVLATKVADWFSRRTISSEVS